MGQDVATCSTSSESRTSWASTCVPVCVSVLSISRFKLQLRGRPFLNTRATEKSCILPTISIIAVNYMCTCIYTYLPGINLGKS